MESWSIKVQKDYLKFSAAHFLIFPDGTAERLHGHNYKVYVEVSSELDPHGLVLNFKTLKPLVRAGATVEPSASRAIGGSMGSV